MYLSNLSSFMNTFFNQLLLDSQSIALQCTSTIYRSLLKVARASKLTSNYKKTVYNSSNLVTRASISWTGNAGSGYEIAVHQYNLCIDKYSLCPKFITVRFDVSNLISARRISFNFYDYECNQSTLMHAQQRESDLAWSRGPKSPFVHAPRMFTTFLCCPTWISSFNSVNKSERLLSFQLSVGKNMLRN